MTFIKDVVNNVLSGVCSILPLKLTLTSYKNGLCAFLSGKSIYYIYKNPCKYFFYASSYKQACSKFIGNRVYRIME